MLSTLSPPAAPTGRTADLVERCLSERFDPAAYRGLRVTVVVPDATRPLHHAAILPPLLARLDEVAREVTVLVALGLHRPMTEAELAPVTAVTSNRVIQHAAHRPAELAEVAIEPCGPLPGRVALHRAVVDADRVICVGVVEPHQYAGFSGGAKAVAIGCASAETITALHGLALLRDPGTRLGALDGNPFQACLMNVAAALPAVDALQVVPHDLARCHAVFFGPVADAFARAAEVSRRRLMVQLDAPCAWLHLPVPAAKAQSFYQASRAATYVAGVSRPVVTDQGALVVEAACPEGAGAGAGELAFARAMTRGVETLLAQLEGAAPGETRGGEQRAFVLAKTLRRFRVALVGAPPIDGLDAMGVTQHDTLEGAIAALGLSQPGLRIEDVFRSVPELR